MTRSMTRTILRFIGFKLAECAGVVLVGYGLYWLGHLADFVGIGMRDPESWYGWMILGFLTFCLFCMVVLAAGLIISGIYQAILWNWKKAKGE